ncbi:MAG: glutathione peroxidase [Bacteroidetes bacterium MedPE-SWsnd-G2]|nr:MAG: glutathione peroxidase [Bacteroidetes bacterium MedPE-SWsnd-G2]
MLARLLNLKPFKLKEPNASLYDIGLTTTRGEHLDLNQFKNKYLLIVNVASKCGFTKQYTDLQKLAEAYKNKLVILACPCNQFANQEPGSNADIANFCSINYNISFPITEKLNVKGSNKHSLYKWLTEKELNGNFNSSVKWNFQKYLINPKGQLLDVFYSTTKPTSKKITSHING